MIEKIETALSDPFNKNKKINQIFFELGIDTMQITDNKSMFIISEYLYYSDKSTGIAPYDNSLWYQAVIILGRIFNRGVL